MRWKDLRPGTVVYHTIFTHWGRGIVRKLTSANMLESMFERGNKRVEVEFEGLDTSTRLRASELRKTPNKKKMRDMVDLYRRRGVKAEISESGEQLLIPEKSK